MRVSNLHGRLYLDEQFVGNVSIRGWDGPWGFGEFEPNEAFKPFAPLFAEWARLMHSPEVQDELTERVGDALRKIENDLYAVDARLYVREYEQWRPIAILTIDGKLIDWKERFAGDGGTTSAAPTYDRRVTT